MSDFEHSYAANVVPKHLTKPGLFGRRKSGSNKVTGLPQSSTDSRDSSRRTSPDKRPSMKKQDTDATLRGGRMSPTLGGRIPSGTITPGKPSKPRIPSRTLFKEPITSPRQPSSTMPKLNSRRVSNAAPVGPKVSNMTRHFERLRRDNEKSQRRYAVIRGRRARPVANTHATAKVLDSIKDAIKDETYDTSSSSEADDEDDGEDDLRSSKNSPANESLSSSGNLVETSGSEANVEHQLDGSLPSVELTDTESQTIALPLATPPAKESDFPPSITSPTALPHTPSETPPASDVEAGPSTMERHSTIMRAISGIWQQQQTVSRGVLEPEGDDPMADPEHIFRESSMVVRTDEPTSIIALALK